VKLRQHLWNIDYNKKLFHFVPPIPIPTLKKIKNKSVLCYIYIPLEPVLIPKRPIWRFGMRMRCPLNTNKLLPPAQGAELHELTLISTVA